MPIFRRPVRALLLATLVVATLIAAAAVPASALEPPRPLPGYRAHFVTETDTRPWIDCLWASGAMLIDKWTNGDVRVSHQRLRRLSGDRSGGSMLDDLARAYKKLGFHLKYSPDGGTRITLHGLLRRLRHGAGAVILGDYSQLPAYYGRWDYGFWRLTKKEKRVKDNHAVYVERYDRKHGRVWLMDPLARGGWHGEWISVWALQRFAWSSGGALYAAVTPTAKPAPFTGVRIGRPTVTRSTAAIDVAWPVRARRHWHFQGVDTHLAITHPADPLLAAVTSPEIVRVGVAGRPPTRATTAYAGHALHARAPLPSRPGAYVAAVRLTDRRFGHEVAAERGLALFVPGPRRAMLSLHAGGHGAQAGSSLDVSVTVTNTGSLTWAETPADEIAGRPSTLPEARNTRVVAHWIPVADDGQGGWTRATDARADGPLPKPVVLGAVPLATDRRALVQADVRVPAATGPWALVIDVEDGIDGSFAALGSAPDFAVYSVVPPRGIGERE